MVDYFNFTKEDPDLLGGVSIRDPLGLQVLWSAMGRKIIPHLTEQTTRVEGFQILITIFYLYEKFKERIERDFNEYRPQLKGKSAKQTFSLENFFFFAEQAFAYVYFNQVGEWNLPGQRQVAAFAKEPMLSERRPILRAQLSNGIWGLYRGAAIRANLLNETGQYLSNDAAKVLVLNEEYDRRSWGGLYYYIRTAMLESECAISTHGHGTLVQMMVDIIDSTPERRLLREHLLNPPNGEIVRPFAEMASPFLREKNDLRALFRKGRREFPAQAIHFENILKCEDYISSLESVFEFLLHFNGKKLETAAGDLSMDLNRFEDARKKFIEIDTWPNGLARQRSVFLAQSIETNSARGLIESLVRAHSGIADSRGAVKWIVIGDDGRIACETAPLTAEPDLRVTPGRGWRYDYYVNPLVSIYRGLR